MSARVCRLARAISLALASLALLLLGCCGQAIEETTVRDIPVDVAHSGIVRGDAREILGVAQQEVWKHLPGAYLNVFAYTGHCDALPNLQGKFNMQFVRVDRSFLRRRELTAFVSIDTSRGMMDIEYLDYTGLGLRANGLTFGPEEIGLAEMARIAYDYISMSGLSDCDVTITRTKQAWNVRCGAIENFVQECLFEIDPSTGEISSADE